MAVADRDELWEVQCQCICAISLTLAKPREAMPGPYSSLMVLRRRASRSGAGRAVRGRENEGQRRRRSDSTFDFKESLPHAPRRGACGRLCLKSKVESERRRRCPSFSSHGPPVQHRSGTHAGEAPSSCCMVPASPPLA